MQPVFYISHGGGPCFFMDWTMGPADTWDRTASWLRALVADLPVRPRALLFISAHWEARLPTVLTGHNPPMLYDYSGFPPHTYELSWPAPGAPTVAERVGELLSAAGIDHATDAQRGFDHGTFVPMLLSVPDADIPTTQLSLCSDYDPVRHRKIGQALAPLRSEGVLIVGSGMSYHSFAGFMRPQGLVDSEAFDAWLRASVALPQEQRNSALDQWEEAPAARASHPQEDHLIPLMVCGGAAQDDLGEVVFSDVVMGVRVSGVRFG